MGGFEEYMLLYNKTLKGLSRQLRKTSTDCESFLWSKLRKKQLKGFQFYRQKVIGNYIVDFYCPKAKLVIELDGGQHYTDNGKQKDEARSNYINSLGLKVVRFSDREVFENTEGVLQTIWDNL